MSKFTITLTENYDTKTYRIDDSMFLSLSFRLAQYRSCGAKSKPVRCIETGKEFNSAMQALKWLNEFGIEFTPFVVLIITDTQTCLCYCKFEETV